MNRREFLKIGAGSAAIGAASGSTGIVSAGTPNQAASSRPSILVAPAEEHRRRLENIAECERGVRKCLRKHLITDYLAGQVVYNLGEYPCRKPWDPDGWDENELARLAAAGIQLVQVHEEWNDSQRLFGADKLRPLNDAGFRRFVSMVHACGMKLIVYASTGFFERRDPDFRPEWARPGDLVEIYFRYARCSPASAGWRAYLLPRLVYILDEYGVDGLYDDLGYNPLYKNPTEATKDEVLAFEESDKHDGALEDLLSIIYGEIRRRGGVFKVHASATSRPAIEARTYDYLWVGESVRDADQMRDAVKSYPPCVVPCLDMSRATIPKEDDLYLHSIPYMQFPLLLAGRPFTGERAAIPGIQYPKEEDCFWTRHCRSIWRHYQTHPDGPHSFGWWDSSPGRPEARPTHHRWLKLYRPMVEPGTRAYLELADTDFFTRPLPERVVASAFANRELYLVLANYAEKEATIETTRSFAACNSPDTTSGSSWKLAGRSLTILKRAST